VFVIDRPLRKSISAILKAVAASFVAARGGSAFNLRKKSIAAAKKYAR
jgi:hypothetical protein